MATVNRELSIALGLDEQGFVSGAAKAEAAAKGFEKELEAVELAAREADAALAKVDGAQLPELTQKAGEAKFRMQELEAATQALVRAGGAIPAAVTQKVDELGSKLDAAATRGQKFQLSLAETQRQAKGAAGVLEGTALAGGKLDGALGSMSSQADKLTGSLGRMSGVIGLVVATFTAALGVGTKIRENWDRIGDTLNKAQPGMKRLFDLLKEAGKEAVDFGAKSVTGVDDATAAYDRLGVPIESNIGKQTRLKNAIKEGTDEIRKAAPAFAAYQDAVKAATAEVEGMEAGLASIAKVQGADFSTWISENAHALLAWYDALDKTGKALADKSAAITRAVDASKAYVAEQLRLSKSVGDTTQAIKDQGAATDEAAKAMVRYGDALRGTAAAGAESTESIKERAKAEAESAAANTQSVLDRMKAEDDARDEAAQSAERTTDEIVAARNKRLDDAAGSGPAEQNAFDPANIERAAAAEQQWAQAILARNAALRESDQIIAAQNEALRQMATAVESVNTSIYDSLPGMREMFDEVSRIADTKLYGGYIKEVFNSFADGTRTLAQTHAALTEVRLGLDKISAMGGGWLGDVLTEISDLTTRLNRAADAAKQAKRDAMWDNSGEDQTGPAGEDRTQGFAAGRTAGGFARLTAELNRTRNP